MTRNFKVLALALATAFAFAALASAASAATHHFTPTTPVKPLKVTANEEQVFTTTTGGKEGFRCKNIEVKGEVAVTSSEATVEPTYTNCETEGELVAKAFVFTNKCHYTFFGTTTKGNLTEVGKEIQNEHANVELICNTEGAGKGIEIKVTELKLACAFVPAQLIKHAVRYEDISVGVTKIIPTAHGIKSETQGSCKNKEGVGANQIHENGVYTGSVTVEGATLTTNATP